MASVETNGPSVDDAIDSALDQLDLDEDQVDIEVLSEGGDGQEARVRVTPRPEAVASQDGDDEPQEDEGEDEDDEAHAGGASLEGGAATPGSPDWDEELATAGREIVEDLLDYMGFPGEVDVLSAGKENGTPSVSMAIVDGDSMGALIGRRGETLQSMQFITQLLVNRRVGHWTRVTLDVEGYRLRRERYLKDTALRSAEKAMRYREAIELDAMIPSERRIVHMTLADHEHVSTHSEGEGANRHIIVAPNEAFIKEHGGPVERQKPLGARPGGFSNRPGGRPGGDRGRPGGDRGGRSGGGGFGGGGYGRR